MNKVFHFNKNLQLNRQENYNLKNIISLSKLKLKKPIISYNKSNYNVNFSRNLSMHEIYDNSSSQSKCCSSKRINNYHKNFLINKNNDNESNRKTKLPLVFIPKKQLVIKEKINISQSQEKKKLNFKTGNNNHTNKFRISSENFLVVEKVKPIKKNSLYNNYKKNIKLPTMSKEISENISKISLNRSQLVTKNIVKIKTLNISDNEIKTKNASTNKNRNKFFKINIAKKEQNSPNSLIIKSHYSLSYPGRKTKSIPKENQDDYISYINENLPIKIFGVFDGHGENGKIISNFIKKYLNSYFTSLSDPLNPPQDPPLTLTKLEKALTENNFTFLKSLYKTLNLMTSQVTNPNLSGSTCLMLLITSNKIISANVGDSRAILITKDKKIIELSHDHKLEKESERKRIIDYGGVVQRFNSNSFNGPLRVWVKDENFPGLAMSRSIGDYIAEDIGVICEPEVIVFDFDGENQGKPLCAVLASDGVWEFMSNEKVKNIVLDGVDKGLGAEEIGNKVYEYAYKMWELNGESMDDITVTVVLFE